MPVNELENTSGQLQVRLVIEGTLKPVANAMVQISYEGDPTSKMQQFITDESGMTELITLAAPNLEYSLQYSEEQPYAEYTIQVQA